MKKYVRAEVFFSGMAFSIDTKSFASLVIAFTNQCYKPCHISARRVVKKGKRLEMKSS